MAAHSGFISTDDSGFLEGVKNGTIIAGVSGVWNSIAVEEAWGSGFGASKLPSYTCAGQYFLARAHLCSKCSLFP